MTPRPALPVWDRDALRAFCRTVLRAFPGATITVRSVA